jgi:hypothetical protein
LLANTSKPRFRPAQAPIKLVMDRKGLPRRRRRARLLFAAALLALAAVPASASAEISGDTTQFSVIPGPIGFGQPPGVTEVPSMTLNGESQAVSSKMTNFAVTDASGTAAGWGLTVSGDDSPGHSPVLRQYCPRASCGSLSGPAFVPRGARLPPDSLMLDSRGAGFTPVGSSSGSGPAQQCDTGCFLDAPPNAPSKIVAAGAGRGMGTFATTGFSSSSLRLAAPETARDLARGEVYRVDLSWTLNTGP